MNQPITRPQPKNPQRANWSADVLKNIKCRLGVGVDWAPSRITAIESEVRRGSSIKTERDHQALCVWVRISLPASVRYGKRQ